MPIPNHSLSITLSKDFLYIIIIFSQTTTSKNLWHFVMWSYWFGISNFNCAIQHIYNTYCVATMNKNIFRKRAVACNDNKDSKYQQLIKIIIMSSFQRRPKKYKRINESTDLCGSAVTASHTKTYVSNLNTHILC